MKISLLLLACLVVPLLANAGPSVQPGMLAAAAPRLGAELGIFMGDVVLLSKSLKGLGKDAEAEQLRTAALNGLQSDELRALASRELAESGGIVRALAEHQMRQAMGPASAAAP